MDRFSIVSSVHQGSASSPHPPPGTCIQGSCFWTGKDSHRSQGKRGPIEAGEKVATYFPGPGQVLSFGPGVCCQGSFSSLVGAWGPLCLWPTSAFLCRTPGQPSLRLDHCNTISLVPGVRQQPVTCDIEPRQFLSGPSSLAMLAGIPEESGPSPPAQQDPEGQGQHHGQAGPCSPCCVYPWGNEVITQLQ